MTIEALFPDVAKVDSLLLALPPGSREKAEAAAASLVAEFRRSVDDSPSLDTVREVSNIAMYTHLIALCSSERLHSACKEAFGVASNRFILGAII